MSFALIGHIERNFEHREPGMGIVAAGTEVTELYVCLDCGVVVALTDRHNCPGGAS